MYCSNKKKKKSKTSPEADLDPTNTKLQIMTSHLAKPRNTLATT